MGTKTLSTSYPARSYGYVDFSPTGGQKGDVTSSTLVRTLTRTRTGVALPNWKKVIDEGGNATTSLTARWEKGFFTPGRCHMSYYGKQWQPEAFAGFDRLDYGNVRRGQSPADRGPQAPTMSSTYADNMARAKFFKRLRKEVSQWSGPTFLGELGEALRMIRRPANALYDKNWGYLEALSKEKRRNPRHWTRAIGGLWLEQAFGWTPLINDLKEAYTAYQRLLEKKSGSYLIQESFKDSADTSSGLSAYDRGGVHAAFIVGFQRWRGLNVVREESVTVRYRGKVKHELRATRWDNYALFGFEAKEIVPTAWQLLPWSFLIDYFFNVEQILNSFVTDKKNLVFVNKTVRSMTEYYGSLTPDPVASGQAQSIYNTRVDVKDVTAPSWEMYRKDITRIKDSGLALPDLQFRFDLSRGQLGNIAALLSQAISLHPQRKPRQFRRDAVY